MNSSFCVAAHGLVYLNHKGGIISSEELAENICTNPARVRKVMSGLKKSGLVRTKEGSVGGYEFLGDPSTVSMDKVAQALDIHFVEASWRSGDTDMNCLVASGMANLMDGIFSDLNQCCMKRLSQVTIADLDRALFSTEKENI